MTRWGFEMNEDNERSKFFFDTITVIFPFPPYYLPEPVLGSDLTFLYWMGTDREQF